ncbi:MAG: GAF domain-containing protein [Bacteroidota bacterium]|nr:GAF domain-containing protein [Bacteroidota bacterium]
MDIKSLLIITFIVNLFLGVFTLIIKQKQKYITDVSYWVIANFLMAGSYLLFGLRGIIPDLFSIVFANTFSYLVIISRYYGFKNMFNKKVVKSEYIFFSIFLIILMLHLSYFTFIDNNIYYRTIFARAGFSFLAIVLGIFMLRGTPKNERFVGQVASFCYFIFAILSIPYILSWVYNTEYRSLFAPNVYTFLMLVTNLFLDIIWSTSLLYISSQRNFEKQIESEKRLQSLFNNSHDGIVMLNRDGKIIDFNPAYSKMLGYSREELMDTDFYKITPENWYNWEQKEVIEKLASDNAFTITYEKEYIRKDNEIFPIELSAFNANDIEGKSHYWGIVKDISERKKNEKSIKARLELNEFSLTHSLNEVLQKTIDLICVLTNSPIGFFHFVDENQEKITLQAWSTNTITDFCRIKPEPGHYLVEDAGIWADCIRTKKPVIHNDYKSLTHKKELPDGHAELVRESIVPILRNGKVVAILGIGNKQNLYDQKDIDFVIFFADVVYGIIERKKQEQEIEDQNIKLNELNATKDKFISILAHDLRNPFSSIVQISEILVEEVKSGRSDNIAKFANVLQKTSKTTYNLLENLLQWARSQQNKIPYNPQKADLYLLVYECLNIINCNAAAKKIDINSEITEKQFIYVDSGMVKTVIRNLLSNAIKFTPVSGKITITSAVIQNQIEITISDTGVGMDENTQNTLFKLGQTKSFKGTEGETGSGFGLILCKEFVEKHGGQIWAETEKGKGCDFKFTMPVYNE